MLKVWRGNELGGTKTQVHVIGRHSHNSDVGHVSWKWRSEVIIGGCISGIDYTDSKQQI